MPSRLTSGRGIDGAVRIPNVHQRADSNVDQLITTFQPSFDLGTLLFADRAALGQTYQTIVIATDITKTVGGHGVTQKLIEECINGLFGQIVFEVQVQLKTQLLEFIHAEFFAQTAGTVSSHGTILKSDNARHFSSLPYELPASLPARRQAPCRQTSRASVYAGHRAAQAGRPC